MTIIQKTIGGVTTEIDLSLVEEMTSTLEKTLRKRESWKNRSHVEYHSEIMRKIKKLNKEQLEYFTNKLLGIIGKYADLYQKILDDPEKECAKIREYKDFFDLMKTS
ncbi:hypothetical protein KAT24_01265 [Candidatus Pacearchaeota archaeon]|nr:hypothetical protein [Candidatus Pacearchaeota archaeon]